VTILPVRGDPHTSGVNQTRGRPAPATPEHRRLIRVPNHPGIYRKGDRFHVRFRHKGRQRTRTFRTKTEAVQFKGQVASGDTLTGSRERFSAYAERWLETYEGGTSNGISEETRASYRDSLERHAFPFFGAIKLEEIDPPFLREYTQHLANKGLAPNTVRRYFAPVRALLGTANGDGLLRSNPARGFRVVVRGDNEDRRRNKRRLSAQQTKDLLSEIPAGYSDLVYLLASTGVRIGECLAFTWSDFRTDADGPTLQITKSKTASGVRRIAISPEAARRLLKRRAESDFSSDDDSIFPTRSGLPMDAHNFRNRVFVPAAKRAGVPWARPHALRHGLATMMAELGYSPPHIAAHLGHADGGVLAMKTYVKVERVKSMAFVDEILSDAK